MPKIEEFPIENKIEEFPIEKKIEEFPVGIKERVLSKVGEVAEKSLGPGFYTGKFKDMTPLGKTLDILGRPSAAIKSLAKEVIEQKGETAPKEYLRALGRGITGEERVSANELYSKFRIEGIPGLGFATEVVIDPLTYTLGGITKAIGKGVVAPTGKAISKIPAIAKAGKQLSATPLYQQFKRAFVNSTGNAQLDNLVKKYTLEREYLQGESFKYGIKVRKVLENISKKTGQSVDDIGQEVVNIIELPQTTTASLPEIQALANTLKTHFSNILTKEMKAGVPITTLSENNRGIQYFPRITTNEAKQYLKQAQIGNAKIWNPKIANALTRRTADFTLDEFNQFVREQGLPSLGGRSVEQFFMRNPAYATTIRSFRSAKATTSSQFLQEAGEIFGKTKSALPYGQELPETITKIFPSLKGKIFDPEILREITRVHEKIFNPKETGEFLKLFDNLQNYWKKWTLMPFLKFHTRNMAGNIWNNYLAGVINPDDYLKATQLQAYSRTGDIKSLSLLGKAFFNKEQADDIILQANKLGVLRGTQFHGDITRRIEEEIGKKLTPVSVGMKTGGVIEDNARLAHFIDKIAKGNSFDEAALSVKKYLFDYNDLTVFEKQVLRRVFPFYTWTRKNIPLQVESLLKQPQKFIPPIKMLQRRDEGDLAKLKYTQPSLYERLPVEAKRSIDSVTYIPLEGLLPAADLAKLTRPQEMFFELLSPYIKAPIELGINKSFFTEREIQKYPKETQEFLRTDIPVRLKYAVANLLPWSRLLGSVNTIIKKKERSLPLTAGEQAFEHGITKVYKNDLGELKVKALQKIERQIYDLKQAYRWAILKGRDNEAKTILKTIDETIKEISKLF